MVITTATASMVSITVMANAMVTAMDMENSDI